MNINIVGTIRNDKSGIIGYLLLDTDDNNKTMFVQKQKLVDILNSKKLKLVNAKLTQGRIQGIYYPLSNLSYITRDRNIVNNGVLVLHKNNLKYTCVMWSNNGIDIKECTIQELKSIKKIINVVNGKLSFPDKQGGVINKSGEVIDRGVISDEGLKEALDIDKVWSTEDFDKFMKAHNWSYEIYGDNRGNIHISNISPECPIIHLPTCINIIDNLYSSKPKGDIRAIILSDKVDEFLNLYHGQPEEPTERIKIEILHIRSSGAKLNKEMILSGLRGITVGNVVRLRTGVTHIAGLLNCSNIKSLEMDCPYTCLTVSFNDTRFSNKYLTVNCDCIEHSFVNSGGYEELSIGDNVECIKDSMMNVDSLEVIEGIQATKLSVIKGFSNCSNLREIDLTNCKSLQLITGFSKVPSLEVVKLPKSDDWCKLKLSADIVDNASGKLSVLFESDKLKELVLSKNVLELRHPIGGANTQIVFDESVTSIKARYYERYNIANGNSIKFLAKQLKLNSYFCILTDCRWLPIDSRGFKALGINPDQLYKFERLALQRYHNKVFDSMEFKNIHELPDELLSDSGVLETLIIDTNITKVGAKVAADCVKLRNIVIGDIDDINDQAFAYIKNSGAIRAYAIQGTKAYKLLKKREQSGIVVIPVDSVEDARDRIQGRGNTSQKMINRFRSLLGGDSECDIFFRDEYISGIQFIYKLYNDIKLNKGPGMGSGYPLDTSNYRDLDLSKYPHIQKFYNDTVGSGKDSGYSDYGTPYNYDLIDNDNVFNALSNLTTKLINRDDRLYLDTTIGYEKDIIDATDVSISKDNKTNVNIVYIDTHRLIATFRIKFKLDIRDEIQVIVIIVDGVIKFMGICSEYTFEKFINFRVWDESHFYVKRADIREKRNANNVSIIQYLKASDILIGGAYTTLARMNNTLDHMIGCIQVPNTSVDIVGAFINSSIVIYAEGNNKYEALYYDLITQKFILCRVSVVNKPFESIVVQGVYTWDTINELKSKYRDAIGKIMDKSWGEILDLVSISKDERESIYKDTNNYDIDNNKLYTLAKRMVGKVDIHNIGIDKLLDIFISSDLYIEENHTLKSLDNKNSGYRLKETIDRGDWQILVYSEVKEKHDNLVIPEYIERNFYDRYGYLYYIKTPKTVLGKKQKCYYGKISIQLVLRLISEIDIASNRGGYNHIGDDYVSSKDFIVIDSTREKGYNDLNIERLICIDRYNGDPYLLVKRESDDFTKCIPVLRFKTVEGLMRFDMKYHSNNTYADYILEDFNAILNRDINYKYHSYIGEYRDKVMGGLPNNLPCIMHKEVLDRLAKQPLSTIIKEGADEK